MDKEAKLQQIQEEITPFRAVMGSLADQILVQDVSRYPIFVVHPATIEVGLPVIEKGETSRWSVNVSTLEEFATKQIIQPEKVAEFRKVYKDPESFLCLFLLSDLGAQFVFMPRD